MFFSCASKKNGEELAKIYCASCHLSPNPENIDKNNWEKSILPRMGWHLGISIDTLNPFQDLSMEEYGVVLQSLLFPSEPAISNEQWLAIKDYYISNAPDSVSIPELSMDSTKDRFVPYPLDINKFSQPTVTEVTFLESQIFVSEANGANKKIAIEDWSIEEVPVKRNISHLIPIGADSFFCLSIGNLFPNDLSSGSLFSLVSQKPELLIAGLQRPVYFSMVDHEQVLISEFGHYTGALNIYDLQTKEKTTLLNQSGALQTKLLDFNSDGYQDIVALFGQYNELVAIFWGQPDASFQMEVVLRFPPEFGSSHLQLADFNEDGKMDILLANGDNADYSQIIKPYHGVRIFFQGEDYQFSEAWFSYLPGATVAQSFDFDLDGDLDIATIAYFPDYQSDNPCSLTLFENKSDSENMQFEQMILPGNNQSRWIVMDIADMDNDKDEDIVVGAMVPGPSDVPSRFLEQWRKSSFDILILENQSSQANKRLSQ